MEIKRVPLRPGGRRTGKGENGSIGVMEYWSVQVPITKLSRASVPIFSVTSQPMSGNQNPKSKFSKDVLKMPKGLFSEGSFGKLCTSHTFSMLLFMTFSVVGCQSVAVDFDKDSAFRYLEEQCAFGPRNPGSKGYYQCLEYLTQTLSAFADTVFSQSFQYTDLTEGKQYDLKNIIARFNAHIDPQILIAAHWDTRPWADQDSNPDQRSEPILGANDGASGVAILLELARIMHIHSPPIGVILVLFDGEDLGQTGVPRSYAQGSLYFAKNLPIPHPEYAIVIDMVGDADLNLPIERYSYQQNPELVRHLWRQAEKLSLPAFKSSLKYTIFDDHVPLWEEANIPAIDIIDFEYPNRYTNYWHTHQDIPQNCSPASLGQVGTLLVNHIYKR